MPAAEASEALPVLEIQSYHGLVVSPSHDIHVTRLALRGLLSSGRGRGAGASDFGMRGGGPRFLNCTPSPRHEEGLLTGPGVGSPGNRRSMETTERLW